MIRPATPDEHDYMRASWLSCLLRGHKSSTSKRARTRATIDQLLATQQTLVDARPGEVRAEDVVGWCCYTPLASTAVVHFVSVRFAHRNESMRRTGIGRSLLVGAGVDLARVIPYTHATSVLPGLLRSTGWRATPIDVREVL